MRVRAAVRRLCDSCRVVIRRKRVFIVCKANPKVSICSFHGCKLPVCYVQWPAECNSPLNYSTYGM